MSPDQAKPLVSIVIPCLNEERFIQRALDALAVQDYKNFEILVVDGGSSDSTLPAISDWQARHTGYRLRLIANPSQKIPRALNLGISAARGDLIARLDGHVRPAPDYLRHCIETLGQPDVGVCGGVLAIQPGAPGTVPAAIARAVSTPMGAGDSYYRIGSQKTRDVDTVPFGCFLRTTWQAVGGYAEELRANEDYDFNYRVRRAGLVVRLDPAIRSDYYARSSYRDLAQQYWRYGWWKARMLIRQPQALRLRQVIPALWAIGGLGLLGGAIGLGWHWAWIPWGLYGAILGLESWRAASRARRIAPAVLLAYLIIHFAWGWGYWAGWVTSFLGRSGGQPAP